MIPHTINAQISVWLHYTAELMVTGHQKTNRLTAAIYDRSTFILDGEEIKVVDIFNFLGSVITSDAATIHEIKQRIAMRKSTMKPID